MRTRIIESLVLIPCRNSLLSTTCLKRRRRRWCCFLNRKLVLVLVVVAFGRQIWGVVDVLLLDCYYYYEYWGGWWLKLYPLLFLNACWDFLFKICYFQFFIFSSSSRPIQQLSYESFQQTVPIRPSRSRVAAATGWWWWIWKRHPDELHTDPSLCSACLPLNWSEDEGAIIIVAVYVFIYRKNVIINCED